MNQQDTERLAQELAQAVFDVRGNLVDDFFATHTASVLRTESPLRFCPDLSDETCRILHAVLGIADEAGELAKAVKAHLFYGVSLDTTNLKEEIGDVMWYLFLLMDAAELNPRDVLETNIRKLRTRYPEKFTTDAATSRDLTMERSVLEGE